MGINILTNEAAFCKIFLLLSLSDTLSTFPEKYSISAFTSTAYDTPIVKDIDNS